MMIFFNFPDNDSSFYPSLVQLNDETHGGDDVAVYARGPWSHLFTGAYEQNLIPHMMGFAANIGPAAGIQKDKNHIQKNNKSSNSASSLNIQLSLSKVIILLSPYIFRLFLNYQVK